MALEEGGDRARALGRRGHPELQRFERAHQEPAGVRVAHRAEDRAHAAHRIERGRRSRAAARDQVGVAADILGQRGHDQVGAVGDRRLKQGSEQGVVDDDDRPPSLGAAEVLGQAPRAADVDKAVGRVRRRLEKERGDRSMGAGLADRLLHRARPAFRRERDRRHAELRQDPCQQKVRAAVDGPRMNDDRARPRVGPERGRDGGHARGEDEVVLRLVPDRQPVLEHFEIGIVDPAVNQARLFVRPLLSQPVGQLEKRLAVLGGAEDEGGGGKDRRLERAFGPERVVAVAHHQRFGRERPVAETPASPSLARHASFSPNQAVRRTPRRGACAGLRKVTPQAATGVVNSP